MGASMLTEDGAREILRGDLGGADWQVLEPRGSMNATRLARHGELSVAVKLIETADVIMTRLSDLGVTPPVLSLGVHEGRPYMIQQAVDGPHPDHAWFLAYRGTWADMVARYLHDPQLRELLAERLPFWRLNVVDALAMINRDLDRSQRRSPALRSAEFRTACERWREQAGSLPTLAMLPIHPDAHLHNYVIADGEPLLLDWDYADLSDPLRDVGSQIWGFLPQPHWAEFVDRVGIGPVDGLDQAVAWWAAFKLLGNALYNDRRSDFRGVEFHIRLFRQAVARRPWV